MQHPPKKWTGIVSSNQCLSVPHSPAAVNGNNIFDDSEDDGMGGVTSRQR
jgi:hypothetical protein